jgi:DNA polymerase-3 subunit delta'
MFFDRILDQKVPKRILTGALKKSLLASSYLFYGEEGTGKWAMALELAKAINCESNATDGCDQCPSCRRIDRLEHPDVKVIFPVPSARSKDKEEKGSSPSTKPKERLEKEIEEYKKVKVREPYAIAGFDRAVNIPVEQIRSLQRDIFLKPFQAKRKVVIIAEAEKMHNSSANSLLKTLEEPPADANLILTSSDFNQLLPTIISRCQQIRFGRIPAELIRNKLVADYQLPPEKAAYLAGACQGSYGKALELLHGEKESLRQDGLRLLSAALEGKTTSILQTVDQLLARWDRNSILEMFKFLASALRDIYMQREGEARLLNSDLEGDLLKLSRRFDRQNTIEHAFQTADRIRFECQARNASQKLGLVSLCLKIKELTKETEDTA